MTKQEFYTKMASIKKTNPHLRWGQIAFNLMYEINPEVANKYRGSDIDPFHKDIFRDIFIDTCFDDTAVKQD